MSFINKCPYTFINDKGELENYSWPTYVISQLEQYEPVAVDSLAKKMYGTNTVSTRRAARNLLCEVRSDLENNMNRVLIVNKGIYELIDKGEGSGELTLAESEKRKHRILEKVETFRRNVRIVLQEFPEVASSLEAKIVPLLAEVTNLHVAYLKGKESDGNS